MKITLQFQYLVIIFCVIITIGCSTNYTQHNAQSNLHIELDQTLWQVEDIKGGGIIDNSMVTLLFEEDGRISGYTGCNRYFSVMTVSNSSLNVGKLVTTRRACTPAISNQERQFIQAIESAVRYQIDSNTWLIMYDNSGNEVLKLIPLSPQKMTSNDHADDGVTHQFFCGDALGIVDIAMLDADTMRININGHTGILYSERKASGAFYAGTINSNFPDFTNSKHNISFWNKGTAAILSMGTENFTCEQL